MLKKDFNVDYYYQRYFKGENPKKLSEEIGCHYATLINRFNEYNLPLLNSKGISLNHNYFKEINTHRKAYFLGLLMSDGCIYKNSIKISLQERDKHILEKFKEELNYNGELLFKAKKKHNHSNQFALDFTSKIMVEHLKNMFIVENKSNIITNLPNIEKEYINSFILGYFDGDGTIGVDKRSNAPIFSIVGNREFLLNLRYFLDDNSIFREVDNINQCTVKHKHSIDYKNKRSFFEIYNYLYKDCDIFLERKKDKFINIMKNLDTSNNRNKKIAQYNMNGELIKIFLSPKELKDELKLDNLDKIHKCLRGVHSSSMGFKWKIIEYDK